MTAVATRTTTRAGSSRTSTPSPRTTRATTRTSKSTSTSTTKSASSAGARRGRTTVDDELMEALKDGVENLVDEIVNGTDEHWQAYAARLAHERTLGIRLGIFKTWSVRNVFYLHAQVRRRAESVKGLYAGKDQWAKLGRQVLEDATPYVIFGAPLYRVRAQAANAAQQNGQQNGQAATGQTTNASAANAPAANTQGTNTTQAQAQQPQYVMRTGRPPAIEVFDWTQTVSLDPDYIEPDWAVPLAYGDVETLHRLVRTSPVPVHFRNIAARNEHGWLDSTGITLDDTMAVGNQIFTLLHELGHHHLGHLEQLNSTTTPMPAGVTSGGLPTETEQEKQAIEAAADLRARCEQEAALVQYLAMQMLGLGESAGNDVTKAAGDYLRSWIRTTKDGTSEPVAGHKPKRKLILNRFNDAFDAADQIVKAYAELDPATA